MMAEMFALDDEEIPFPHKSYPLSYPILQQEQRKDTALQKRVLKGPRKFPIKEFRTGNKTYPLRVTFDERIVVPKSLQQRTVKWYHDRLMHPGETRTELSIAQQILLERTLFYSTIHLSQMRELSSQQAHG